MECQSGRRRARSFLQPEGNVDRLPGEGLNEDLEQNWKHQPGARAGGQFGHSPVSVADGRVTQLGL